MASWSPAPLPVTLAKLHEEALRCAGLQTDDTPFLLLTNHRDSYNQLIQQLPPSNSRTLQALSTATAAVNLSHLHQPPRPVQTLGRSIAAPNHSSHARSRIGRTSKRQGNGVPVHASQVVHSDPNPIRFASRTQVMHCSSEWS